MSLLAATRKLLALPLFQRPAPLDRPLQIIQWWESRRIPFNLIVGVTGLVTLAALFGLAALSESLFGDPIGQPDPPLFAIIPIFLYGVAANVCYTGGWIIELLVRQLWPGRTGAFGEITFFLGLLLSTLLTLAPAALTLAFLALRLLLLLLND